MWGLCNASLCYGVYYCNNSTNRQLPLYAWCEAQIGKFKVKWTLVLTHVSLPFWVRACICQINQWNRVEICNRLFCGGVEEKKVASTQIVTPNYAFDSSLVEFKWHEVYDVHSLCINALDGFVDVIYISKIATTKKKSKKGANWRVMQFLLRFLFKRLCSFIRT